MAQQMDLSGKDIKVKYAEAPVGELRYKKPVPIAPWSGVKDATKHGREFPSGKNFHEISDEERFSPDLEDCLSLCVYSTDLTASHPVMVFIHGGGFFNGSSRQSPPNYLLEKDIVLVVPQYRIGPLGFLSTMSEEIPGNAGILDVILALEWVQKNIEHFGGDPKAVTLFGQSAGGAVVSALSFSDIVREDLFSRVIIQSVSAFSPFVFCEDPVKSARDIATKSGCPKEASLEEINEFFMKIDPKTLIYAFLKHVQYETPNGIGKIGGSRLTLGGPSKVFSETPFNIVRRGGGRKDLALMAGVTKNDYTYVMLIDLTNRALASDEQSGMLSAYTVMQLLDIEALKAGDFYSMIEGICDHAGSLTQKAPLLREVQYHLQRSELPLFLYSFDYKGQHTRFNYGPDPSKYPFESGVAHTDDLIYLFPWPEKVAKLNEEDTKIAQLMVDLWTSFATTGIPASPLLGSWPAMRHIAGPYLKINKECTIAENFYDEFKVNSQEKKDKTEVDQLQKTETTKL
ncbi:glutactin-like [Lutzomyia longipalpis]|uniref:glutactin-like n=1 Tax=Lutzomyia longipalpis TaxID=7200 RepID=UPI0024838ACF|nr:glutactin-like [Lutzomyia longipalpis]